MKLRRGKVELLRNIYDEMNFWKIKEEAKRKENPFISCFLYSREFKESESGGLDSFDAKEGSCDGGNFHVVF